MINALVVVGRQLRDLIIGAAAGLVLAGALISLGVWILL